MKDYIIKIKLEKPIKNFPYRLEDIVLWCYMPKTDSVATKGFVKKTVEKATKELRQEMKGLHNEINGLHNEVSGLHGEFDSFNKKVDMKHNEIMASLDSISGSIQKFDQEQTATSYRVSQHTDQLDNHEERISHLEPKPAT